MRAEYWVGWRDPKGSGRDVWRTDPGVQPLIGRYRPVTEDVGLFEYYLMRWDPNDDTWLVLDQVSSIAAGWAAVRWCTFVERRGITSLGPPL